MSALEDFQSRGSATHTLVIRRAPRCLRASTRPVSRCHKGKSCGIFPPLRSGRSFGDQVSRTQSVRAERQGEDSQCWRRRGGACGGCRLPPGGASSFSPFFPPILSPVASVSTFPPLPGCSIYSWPALEPERAERRAGPGRGARPLCRKGKQENLKAWRAGLFPCGSLVTFSQVFMSSKAVFFYVILSHTRLRIKKLGPCS